jgi:hypothetical protein
MSEPLIVVEGNLRLPTTRSPTDPSLSFGFEWSPMRSRPVQSQSETALFAARFVTAYVPALSLSDIHSPYRATSLWGVFSKEEIPRAMLHLTEGSDTPDQAGETRAAPVHLAVNAPSDAGKHGFSKPIVATIAAACGVLIVWLLFSHAPVSRSTMRTAPAEEVRIRTQPGQPAAATAALTATAAPTRGQIAQPSEALASSAVAAPVSADSRTIAAVDPAATDTKAAPAATTPEKTRVRFIAPTEDRKHNVRVRAVLTPHTKRAALRAHTVGERVVKQEAPRRAHATSVERVASQPTKVAVSMDPTTLYSMLQHSPTLDSNAASYGRGAANGAR